MGVQSFRHGQPVGGVLNTQCGLCVTCTCGGNNDPSIRWSGSCVVASYRFFERDSSEIS